MVRLLVDSRPAAQTQEHGRRGQDQGLTRDHEDALEAELRATEKIHWSASHARAVTCAHAADGPFKHRLEP